MTGDEQRGVRLISYDRPGYGGSTARPGGTVADSADDVSTIADAFDLERIAVWGISGGGPHALACAALLPDLVCAAATLSSPAPFDADGLDYMAGMGQANADDLRLMLDDPVAAREKSQVDRQDMLGATPEELHEMFASLLTPVDRDALTLDLAAELVAGFRAGLAPGDQGWWDDNCSAIAPWGFSLDDIEVPVQVWHGEQDRFVPFDHGRWLAEHIPGADARLLASDGHVSIAAHRVPEVHAWLLQHR